MPVLASSMRGRAHACGWTGSVLVLLMLLLECGLAGAFDSNVVSLRLICKFYVHTLCCDIGFRVLIPNGRASTLPSFNYDKDLLFISSSSRSLVSCLVFSLLFVSRFHCFFRLSHSQSAHLSHTLPVFARSVSVCARIPFIFATGWAFLVSS